MFKSFNYIESSHKWDFFLRKIPIFFHEYATYSKLPSDVSTMDEAVILWYKCSMYFVYLKLVVMPRNVLVYNSAPVHFTFTAALKSMFYK